MEREDPLIWTLFQVRVRSGVVLDEVRVGEGEA